MTGATDEAAAAAPAAGEADEEVAPGPPAPDRAKGDLPGKAIGLFFAIVVGIAAVVVLAYHWQEAGRPPAELRFEARDAPEGVNATVLEFRPVHAAYFLEDHLDEAVHRGLSVESVRLRVETVVGTLSDLTGQPGPEWWVVWEGRTVRVELVEGAS